jgi:hypothetical protein
MQGAYGGIVQSDIWIAVRDIKKTACLFVTLEQGLALGMQLIFSLAGALLRYSTRSWRSDIFTARLKIALGE